MTKQDDYDRHLAARKAFRAKAEALLSQGYTLAELAEAMGNEAQLMRSRLWKEEANV